MPLVNCFVQGVPERHTQALRYDRAHCNKHLTTVSNYLFSHMYKECLKIFRTISTTDLKIANTFRKIFLTTTYYIKLKLYDNLNVILF